MSGFPAPHGLQPHGLSTVSHWQATNKGPNSLWGHGASGEIVSEADVVVIGGGISGAGLAYYMSQEDGGAAPGEKYTVAVLEAKDIASGASGRNGGHLCPATYHAYPDLIAPFPEGPEVTPKQAIEILEFEVENYHEIKRIVEKHDLRADIWYGELIDVYRDADTKTMRREERRQYLEARRAVGLINDDERGIWIEDVEEAKKVSRCFTAVGAATRSAGSVHSHKLVTELFRVAIENPNINLYSHCPVLSIESTDGVWTVNTSRGSITTKKVILATNAHTPTLLGANDIAKDFIYPQRANCCVFTPPPSYSGKNGLKHTYGWGKPYMVTTATGQLVFGGGRPEDDTSGVDEYIGCTDDSKVAPGVVANFGKFPQTNFEGWGEEADGEGLTRAWSGIVGRTKDTLPLVGSTPYAQGLYYLSGWAGHGMSRTMVCSRGIAHELKTGKRDERVPFPFAVTKERLERAAKFTVEEAAQSWFSEYTQAITGHLKGE